MSTPPDNLPAYRLLTGPDDATFCRRVSEAIALGYELYGSPSVTYNGATVIAAQAVLWPASKSSSEQQAPALAEELAATVARMEAHLRAATNKEVIGLIAAYAALVPRFEQDLSASARDVSLAKASALMLVQERANASAA